jgi:hypothetical protein
MSNRDQVVEFLRSAGHAGATNEEIVSHTGIRPHQQVFTITRELMRQGTIKGVQSGKEWRFWLADGEGAGGSDRLTPAAGAARPIRLQRGPTPAEFERLALIAMSNVFGTRLAPGRVSGVPKLFDCVSQDGSIVGDAKFYTLVEGERLPPAKFSIVAEHVWLLEKTRAPRKFLVFGNDRRVPEQWLRRYGHLTSAVEFFFIDHGGVATRLDTPTGEQRSDESSSSVPSG